MGGAGDALAGIDLGAWQPPPVPSGIADAVILRMREPVAVAAHDLADAASERGGAPSAGGGRELEGRRARQWPWRTTGGVVAAAGVAASMLVVVAWALRGASSGGEGGERGDVAVERASHLDLGATSAELDAGAALAWRREGSHVIAVQRAGAATWRVGSADRLEIDPGAMGASIEASGASLRVEVRMQINGSDTRVVVASAVTAAAVALVSVIVYQGHVKATSAGQTVNVAAGSAVEIRPGERPREVRELATARAVGGGDGKLDDAVLDAALRGAAAEITVCLAGQSGAVTARGKVRADGSVEEIEVMPAGDAASCVAGAVRNARFEPTSSGGRFVRELHGDPAAPPPVSISPKDLDANRIKGNRNIMPDDFDKRAIVPDEKVIAGLKMCIDREGKVSLVRIVKSSGYPGYDRKIETEMRRWEYSPYLVDGKPTPVCTLTTFIYTQQ